MHRALGIPEIILEIFDHFYSSDPQATAGLAALARTCRAFKEPALDILWADQVNLVPLVQCFRNVYTRETSEGVQLYAFRRSLKKSEWKVLRSYARRIRTIREFQSGIDWHSVRTFLRPRTTDPLFPNLRCLHLKYEYEFLPLLDLPLPSLISLDVEFTVHDNLHLFQAAIETISPDIRMLSIRLIKSEVAFSQTVSNAICRLQNLQIVDCPEIILNMTTLVHLFRVPGLTRLAFELNATLPDQIHPSDAQLLSPNLRELELNSECLGTITKLLERIRLATILDLTVRISKCPSREDLAFFMDQVHVSGIGHTVQGLQCTQICSQHDNLEPLLLGLDDLSSCTRFSNLRRIDIDIEWHVDVEDEQLLNLVSAWPHLTEFAINKSWGWGARRGMTPNGWISLLQDCGSLRRVALAVDVRDYTDQSTHYEWTLSPSLAVDFIDSVIEEEDIPAMTSFLAGVLARCDVSFGSWADRPVYKDDSWRIYYMRWKEAYDLAVAQHSATLDRWALLGIE